MFFTEEDYKKIEKYFASCGVKDSCLEDAKLPIEGNEKIAIVQNGENRILCIRELIEALSNNLYKYSGNFNNKPSYPDVGFAYFCTDKQTTEGTTNGIMIYHKGDNVWVDALGRVVS